jgi:hypothetical protein
MSNVCILDFYGTLFLTYYLSVIIAIKPFSFVANKEVMYVMLEPMVYLQVRLESAGLVDLSGAPS